MWLCFSRLLGDSCHLVYSLGHIIPRCSGFVLGVLPDSSGFIQERDSETSPL